MSRRIPTSLPRSFYTDGFLNRVELIASEVFAVAFDRTPLLDCLFFKAKYKITNEYGSSNQTMQLIPVKFKLNKNEFMCDYPPKIYQNGLIVPKDQSNGPRPTFQETMKLTNNLGQCFALNPVLGISESDASKMRFTFWSGRCIYTILSTFGQSILVFFVFVKLVTNLEGPLTANTSIVFYTTNTITTVLFLQLATKWPKLCQQIERVEAADPNMPSNLITKCNVTCIVILLMALLEHLLSVLSSCAIAIDCQPERPLYEAYLLASFNWIWRYIPYNLFCGIILQFLNFQCTFNWNFADVFVICISYYLSSRLEQVNKRMAAVQGQNVPSSFWRTMREDYSRNTSLVRKVDNAIGSIIFISFANNLFFICLQLLNSLEPLKGYEQAVYFVYSFSFLFLRSLAVSLIAARVHTASREPAYALYDVPSTSYCIEVQRFLLQVHGDTVALSGLQFFNVKRGLVLTVAATIVTYELVLMQFAGVTPTVNPPTIASPFIVNNILPSSTPLDNSTLEA